MFDNVSVSQMALIYAAILGWGVHQMFAGVRFPGLNEIFLVGKAVKFIGILQKNEGTLINFWKSIENLKGKRQRFPNFFNFSDIANIFQ